MRREDGSAALAAAATLADALARERSGPARTTMRGTVRSIDWARARCVVRVDGDDEDTPDVPMESACSGMAAGARCLLALDGREMYVVSYRLQGR